MGDSNFCFAFIIYISFKLHTQPAFIKLYNKLYKYTTLYRDTCFIFNVDHLVKIVVFTHSHAHTFVHFTCPKKRIRYGN